MESIVNRVRVKICGLTRGRDVRAAVEAGADAIGFVFAEGSKRLLQPDHAASLVREVPPFIARVGLFLNQEAESVARILDQVSLNLLQFHGTEDALYCGQFGLPYIKAVTVDSEWAVEKAEQQYTDAAGLLLDSHVAGGLGGTGRVFDWRRIGQSRLPLILAGGLTVENVNAAVRQVRPWAVDVSSGVEDSPGIKSADKIQKFINEAKREY